VAPRFQELACGIEDGDAWVGGARGHEDAILAIDYNRAAVAILHAIGQRAPGAVERVLELAVADGSGRFVGGVYGGANRQRRGRSGGPLHKITAGQTVREQVA